MAITGEGAVARAQATAFGSPGRLGAQPYIYCLAVPADAVAMLLDTDFHHA